MLFFANSKEEGMQGTKKCIESMFVFAVFRGFAVKSRNFYIEDTKPFRKKSMKNIHRTYKDLTN